MFAAHVQTDIKRYLHSMQDGYCFPNWLFANSDIRKLERMWCSKIPLNQRFRACWKITTTVLTFNIYHHSRDNKSHRNPVRDVWKEFNFPKAFAEHSAKESAADILARWAWTNSGIVWWKQFGRAILWRLEFTIRAATFLRRSRKQITMFSWIWIDTTGMCRVLAQSKEFSCCNSNCCCLYVYRHFACIQ